MQTSQSNSSKKNRPDNRNDYMRYASMGTQMLIIMVLGVFGGFYLDKWLGLKIPVFTLLLSLLSVFAAIYLSVKDFIKKK